MAHCPPYKYEQTFFRLQEQVRKLRHHLSLNQVRVVTRPLDFAETESSIETLQREGRLLRGIAQHIGINIPQELQPNKQPVKLLDLPPELLATIVEYYMTVHGRHSGFAYDHLSHIARPYEGILAEETATIVNTLLKPLRCSRTLFETALQKVMRMNVIIIRAHLEIVGISDPLDSHTWITHEPARLLANVRFIDLTLELGGYELCEDRQFYLEAEEGFSLEGHRQRLPRALNVIAHVPEIFPRLQAVHFYLDLPQRADYAWSPPANLTSWTETDPWGKWWQEREAVLKSLALIVREVAAMPGLRKTMARDYLVLDSKRVQVAGMNDEEVATKILTAGYEETLFCF